MNEIIKLISCVDSWPKAIAVLGVSVGIAGTAVSCAWAARSLFRALSGYNP
ncbi:MAG TPA: hypothetical protein PLP33_14670 [Leptospiraceae bacterium]|nr:hypothetical protein [Leptospiraceae bacterium]